MSVQCLCLKSLKYSLSCASETNSILNFFSRKKRQKKKCWVFHKFLVKQCLILRTSTQKPGSEHQNLYRLQVSTVTKYKFKSYKKFKNGTKHSIEKTAFLHHMQWPPKLLKCQTDKELMSISLIQILFFFSCM